MPNDLLIASNNAESKENIDTKDNDTEGETDKETVEEVDNLTALRVNLDEERDKEKTELKTTMTNEDATTDEKNNAYNGNVVYVVDYKRRGQSRDLYADSAISPGIYKR